ncbi:NAD(P)/FAD-dependent oxidoreductase [Pseudogulbenkiania sp. MAI-1]|uniref:NAD(P)/FAD-dependent oxidoreductase n=1 Tax=Pseudogulbenkiania sp. MAI-1 TaxID=990370 RepID=UPI0004A27A38|nr:NAD(P)/FAD-dependent oxidoreductase [Pseudogulbenkiania sp. MAI-1]
MDRIDTLVIGAGVIGLAVARALALQGREVIVAEAEAGFGLHTSSRNSEVIHAGLYYPTGSLKARLCLAGREALYRYCAEHGVPHRRLGKLIVATQPDDMARLAQLAERAAANGVTDLRWLDRAELAALEPELAGHAALLSPSTGIVDSHALMLALLGDAEAAGALLAPASPIVGGRVESDGIVLEIGGDEPYPIKARSVVNAAGLWAHRVAAAIEGVPPATIPTVRYARGVYFTLSGRAPFSHLIYPLPVAGGLGTHLTLDLAGQARFGPDVEWIDTVDYSVDPARGARFAAAVRPWWPGLPDDALQPGYAGIRPKLAGPGEPDADFLIQDEREHGVAGLINLYGIESPGLTSCLALADEVARRLA